MMGRVVLALVLGGFIAPAVRAQTPSASTPPAATATAAAAAPTSTTTQAKPAPADVPPPPPTPAALPARPANHRQQQPAAARNPIARANANANANINGEAKARDPLTIPGRFANPGGVGKYSEYYTANTPMNGYYGPRNHLATFGNGGALTRAEQINTFQAGQFRAQNIQNNINAYGRPVGFGFGYGFGGYGGLR